MSNDSLTPAELQALLATDELKVAKSKTMSGAKSELVNKPVQAQVQESAQEPLKKPVQASVQEPVQGSVQESVQEPVQASVQEPVQEPMQESVQDPVPQKEPTLESKQIIDLRNIITELADRVTQLELQFASELEARLQWSAEQQAAREAAQLAAELLNHPEPGTFSRSESYGKKTKKNKKKSLWQKLID